MILLIVKVGVQHNAWKTIHTNSISLLCIIRKIKHYFIISKSWFYFTCIQSIITATDLHDAIVYSLLFNYIRKFTVDEFVFGIFIFTSVITF